MIDEQMTAPPSGKVMNIGNGWLHVDEGSRDAIVSANSFLAMLSDAANDKETRLRLDRLIGYFSNMLYGFSKDSE